MRSRNVPALWVASKLSNPTLYDFLKTSGVSRLKSESHYGLALVLGGAEVTMEELAMLYAVLPGGGLCGHCAIRRPIHKRRACGCSAPKPASRSGDAKGKSAARRHAADAIAFGHRPGRVEDRHVLRLSRCVDRGRDWAVCAGGVAATSTAIATQLSSESPRRLHFIFRSSMRCGSGSTTCRNHRRRGLRTSSGLRSAPSLGPNAGALPQTDQKHLVCSRSLTHRHLRSPSPSRNRHAHRSALAPDRPDRFCSEVYEFWPSDLLRLFRIAGLPAGHRRRMCRAAIWHRSDSTGLAPKITSPLRGVVYTLRPGLDRHRYDWTFSTTDADVGEVFWFANDKLLGNSRPSIPLLWRPQAGQYVVRGRRRSRPRRFTAGARPNLPLVDADRGIRTSPLVSCRCRRDDVPALCVPAPGCAPPATDCARRLPSRCAPSSVP